MPKGSGAQTVLGHRKGRARCPAFPVSCGNSRRTLREWSHQGPRQDQAKRQLRPKDYSDAAGQLAQAPDEPADSQAGAFSSGFGRESVLWKPLPLKWTPTGLNTRLVPAPHSGQLTGASSEDGLVISKTVEHFVHLKSYAGMVRSLHGSMRTAAAPRCEHAGYNALTNGRKEGHWYTAAMDQSAKNERTHAEGPASQEPAQPDDVPVRTGWQPPVFGGKRRSLVPRWVPIAAAAVLVVTAAVVVVVVLMAQSAIVRVPALAGLDQTAAGSRLQEAGLVLKVGDRRFSATVAPGLVVDQSPVPGAKVPEGTAVVVALSAGTESFAMPDVIGLPLDQARKRLRDRGLSIDVQTEPSDKPQGTVVTTFPSPGVTVATGDTVRISVAAGSNAANALLPTNMAGKTFVLDPAPMPTAGGVDAPLDIVRRLRALLEASGARVVVTRDVTDSGDAASTLNRAKRAKEASAAALVGFAVTPSGQGGLSVISVPGTKTTEAFYLTSNSLATGLVDALKQSGKAATTSPASNDPIVTATGIPAVRLRLGSSAVPADKLTFTDPQWADDVARAVYRDLSTVYGSK